MTPHYFQNSTSHFFPDVMHGWNAYANDNPPVVYAGENVGGGYTVYDYRAGQCPILDFYTEEGALNYVARNS